MRRISFLTVILIFALALAVGSLNRPAAAANNGLDALPPTFQICFTGFCDGALIDLNTGNFTAAVTQNGSCIGTAGPFPSTAVYQLNTPGIGVSSSWDVYGIHARLNLQARTWEYYVAPNSLFNSGTFTFAPVGTDCSVLNAGAPASIAK